MKKSITKRFKVTRNGKILRRPMAIDHFKSKNSGVINQDKKRYRHIVDVDTKIINSAKVY